MRVELFDFELPAERIAQRPAEPRDSARLLEVGADAPVDRLVRDLPSLVREGDLLVFNDTRVIPARLRGIRPGDGGDGPEARRDVSFEALLVRRLADGAWRAFCRPGKRLKPGDTLRFGDGLTALVRDKTGEGALDLVFDADEASLPRLLDGHGAVPLPPYIRGGIGDERDRADYQTVYAARDGAVAAPTAGLHFTPALLAALREKGVATAMVTLHVGAGTFQPVRVADTDSHVMHAEWGEVGAEAVRAIAQTRARGGRVVSVGTTALRLLESVAAARDGRVEAWSGETAIFITPGFRFRVVDLLLTNFHLPRSTLFMLVSAFAGLGRMQAAYAHAVARAYRFYSYGDATLLHRNDQA
ncbi:MAG: tRNA preQ1(34) S-adenosylmethionine ribosyltransferase-isomerase QueA [Alphaproteobacteria bacterium]|nr:tRNA preQ1(34) S-adenosylmethionine ribosyltransferase-isomerase QueA [Alphaproteobacteria bacterium]MCW5742117.1 tRNA preQ1(34) S-adenosylmethionine ribosyltransferase-isomerase QueA [Alphaproteobacteria bacterium]